MTTLLEFINAMESGRMTRSFKNAVDLMFDGWRRKTQHFAVRQYKKYKLAAEMYALSDFLIMVFVMVSEAVT